MIEVAVEGNFAQHEHDLQLLQSFHLAIKKRRAVSELLSGRLVVRRSATSNGGDVDIAQLQAIAAVSGRGLRGKAHFVQDGIHEVAGAIPGEWTAGAVGAVGAGSKSEDQHSRFRITEAGHWLSPVLPVHIGAALLPSDLLAVRDQARAAGAGNDLLVEDR